MKAKKTHTHPDEVLNVITEDGFPICGDIWHGDSGPIVVIHSATGVQACYYARFARWLAGLGATVVTFDYRGIGKSRFKSTEDLKAGWALLHNSADGPGSPFPGRTYPAASVTGMPSAV